MNTGSDSFSWARTHVPPPGGQGMKNNQYNDNRTNAFSHFRFQLSLLYFRCFVFPIGEVNLAKYGLRTTGTTRGRGFGVASSSSFTVNNSYDRVRSTQSNQGPSGICASGNKAMNGK